MLTVKNLPFDISEMFHFDFSILKNYGNYSTIIVVSK